MRLGGDSRVSDRGAVPPAEWTPERMAALSRNIALIVVGGVLFGIFATFANFYWVGVAIGIALLIVLVAWQFEAALLVYVLVAFVPWGRTPNLAVGGSGFGKGVYVSEIMLGCLLVVWFGKYILRALPKERIRSGFHVPIILYVAYSTLCLVSGFIFWDPHVDSVYQYPAVNMIELGFRFLSAGAFVMMATSISNRKWLVWTTVFILVPGFYNLFNALIGGRIPLAAPWWPLVALLPICYSWAVALDTTNDRLKRAAGAAVVAVAVFLILVRSISWVSGWFGLVAALGAVTLIKSRRVFLVGVIAVAMAAGLAWPFFHTNVVVRSMKEGDFARFALLRGGWKYATTFPLGVGPGNYRTYNSFYYGEKWGTTSFTSAHGTYAQHLAEMGIPGLVLFLSILVCGFVWMLKSYHRMPPGMSKTYLMAAMGQLVGISFAAFIGDYIIPTYHNGGIVSFSGTIYSWLAWGLAAGHVRLQGGENG